MSSPAKQSGNRTLRSSINSWRLSTKLILVMTLLSVISMIASAVVATYSAQSELEKQISEQLTSTAELEGDLVGDSLKSQVDLMRTLSTELMTLEAIRASNSSYSGSDDAVAEQLLAQDAEWQSESDTGLRLIDQTLSSPFSARLRTMISQFPQHAEIFVTDRQGALIAASGKTSDYYQADEDWWQAGWNKGAGAIHFGPPELDESSGVVSIAVTVPMTDPQSGEVVGILKDVYSIDALNANIEASDFGTSGRTYIIDADGNFVAGQNITIGDSVPGSLLMDGRVFSGTGYDLRPPTVENDEVPVVAGFAPVTTHGEIEEIDRIGWVVLTVLDFKEAYAPLDKIIGTWRIFTLISTLLTIAAAWLIGRGLTRGLSTLATASARVGSGDLTARAEIGSRDEIGQLAASFNQMADTMQAGLDHEIVTREVMQVAVSSYLEFVKQVTDGDLTQRLNLGNSLSSDTDDPLSVLGESLNRMVDSLAEMIAQSQATSSKLAIAAAEILASTTQQLSSSTEQDASITETTTTVDEVRRTVAQTAERADEVAQIARRSVEVSERGTVAVNGSIEGMDMIGDKVRGIAENILALSEKTQQIGEIISSVNDIAEQSKMLALNASIEAARAGEEGRGFAVVAMEVRTLAEQSREATEQVRLILNEIQQATNAAVMATEEGSKGVDAGQERVAQAGHVIDELAQVIRDAAQAATQIAASTRQQTIGMEQLSAAMDTIRQASTQGQAGTQQAEHAAQDLNDMANEMQRAISRYKLENGRDNTWVS